MRLLTNAFIIFHLFIITAWLFPLNSHILDTVNFFRRYIVFLGLDQNYGMFAPDPRKTNRHIFALVTFQDQSTLIYTYPRVERLDYVTAMFKERYRKFGNDNIVQGPFSMFLPDFAKYIARLYTCPDNPVHLVSIYMWEENIPEPEKRTAPASEASCEPKLANIFTYMVEAYDFAK